MRSSPILPVIALVLLAGCGKDKHHSDGVDLVISADSVAPASPTSDDTITVGFTVANNGPNAASAVKWQVRVEDQVLDSGVIPSLAGHASAPGTVSFHALEPGTKMLFLSVDPDNTVAEDNNNDNNTAVPITIASAPPHLDLQFLGAATLDASPTSSNAMVRFTIRNVDTGSSTAATNVHWHIYDNGVSIGSNTIASIPANGTQNQSFLLTGTSGGTAGTHHLSIVIDPHHAITESDETNNSTTVDAVIAPGASG